MHRQRQSAGLTLPVYSRVVKNRSVTNLGPDLIKQPGRQPASQDSSDSRQHLSPTFCLWAFSLYVSERIAKYLSGLQSTLKLIQIRL